ncbi:insulinase family protein [Catenovulum adriaticum]|uniref:Protease 3 n=1 Tax=Catenovulum adriaticum TaxID=2984846 RepID=A0ABY7AN44_9ALTE|nr:insulinase family protein [Catenovulum sp. TS8]WAJ70987.1 insulinase family protein [Catenovulum sp. TS8]
MIKTVNKNLANYKSGKLENGLQILTVQSQQQKAGVAMAVNAGNYQDPDEHLGLAHFLEHMLFLGTQTTPDPEKGFKNFVEKRGGRCNAWTSLEYTNFFYDIPAQFLADSLAQFSQLFSCPLFSEYWIAKEVQSIDHEFHLKLKDDIRRLHEVHKETSNPKHPFSRFNTGNKQTLNADAKTLQSALFDLFEQNYHASNMCLVIVGPQSCDELLTLAQTHFSQIKANKSARKTLPQALYLPEQLGVKFQVTTLKASNRIIFSFPLPSEQQNYLAKSLTYLSCLFGHEGEGSLLSGLKKLELATSLTAGGGLDTGTTQDFNLSIQLTQYGFNHAETVCETLFAYINFLKEQPYCDYIYQEKKQLSELAFAYQDAEKPIDLASQLALKMHHYSLDNIMVADYLMSGVDPEWLNQAYSALTPDNLRLTLLSSNTLTNIQTTPRISTWYQVPYTVEPLSQSSMEQWKNAQATNLFKLPKPNPYLPSTLPLKNSGYSDPKPHKILTEKGVDIWFKQETRFQAPHGHIYISLDLPNSQGNCKKIAMTRLFIELFMDDVAQENYPAQAAGIHYQISPHQAGMRIHISGYAEKQAVFTKNLLSQFRLRRFTQKQFEHIKQVTLSSWFNSGHIKPANKIFNQLTYMMQNNQFSHPDLAESIQDLDFAQFAEFSVHLFERVNLEAYLVGYWDMTQALPLAQTIKDSLLARAQPCSEVNRRVYQIPNQATRYHMHTPHQGSCVVHYYQADDIDEKSIATYMLLTELLSPISFQVLRSEKQLGYLVGCAYFPINRCPGLVIYVQSSQFSSTAIAAEIRQMLNDLPEYLSQLEDQDWQSIKQALIYNLTDRQSNLHASAQSDWMSIGLKDHQFRRQNLICEAIQQTSLEDIKTLIQSVFVKTQTQPPRGLVLTAAPQTDCSDIQAMSSTDIIRDFQQQANTLKLN